METKCLRTTQSYLRLERLLEAAREVGVNLKQGYNGDLSSKEAGSVGGQMVKKMCPGRMFEFTRRLRSCTGHEMKVQYIVSLIA